MAPAATRVIIAKCEYSSYANRPASISCRMMRSDPTPGLPLYEKMIFFAQPAATIWS